MSEVHREEPKPDSAPLTSETIAILKEVGERLKSGILKPTEEGMQGLEAAKIFSDYDKFLARLSSGRSEV